MLRKIKRNMLKNKLGTNKIQKAWRKIQIKKLGELAWLKLYKATNKCRLSRNEIYL